MLHTQVWKRQSKFSFEKFIQQHRNALVSMNSCAEYVQYQIPTEHTRVGYLLAGIQCNDAGLQATMASVQIYMIPTGKIKRFESTGIHLLPYNPVDNKITSNKQGSSEISDTSKIKVSRFGTQARIGKIVVHLR